MLQTQLLTLESFDITVSQSNELLKPRIEVLHKVLQAHTKNTYIQATQKPSVSLVTYSVVSILQQTYAKRQ